MDSQLSSDEDDLFECGRCRTKFSSLEGFMEHKNNRVCRKQKQEVMSPAHGTADTGSGSGAEENDTESEEPNEVAKPTRHDLSAGDNIIMAASIASGIDNLAAVAAIECQKQEQNNQQSEENATSLLADPPEEYLNTSDDGSTSENDNEEAEGSDAEIVEIALAAFDIKCTFCNSVFTNHGDLKEHLVTTHRISEEQVEKLVQEVEKTQKKKAAIRMKAATKTKDAVKMKASMLNKVSLRKSLGERGRKRLPTDCSLCCKVFTNRKNFLRHNKSKHHLAKLQQQYVAEAQGKRLKKCNHCSFTVSNGRELTDHIKNEHGFDSLFSNEIEEEMPKTKRTRGRPRKTRPLINDDYSDETKACSECGKEMKIKLLAAHVKRCLNKNSLSECSECGKAVIKRALYRHQRRCLNKKHLVCPLCQHQSRERYDYSVHINNHKTWLPAEPGDVAPKQQDEPTSVPLEPDTPGDGNRQPQDGIAQPSGEIGDDQDTIPTLDLSVLGLAPTPTAPVVINDKTEDQSMSTCMSTLGLTPTQNVPPLGIQYQNDICKNEDPCKNEDQPMSMSILGLTPTQTLSSALGLQEQNDRIKNVGSEEIPQYPGEGDSMKGMDISLSPSNQESNSITVSFGPDAGGVQKNIKQKQLKCHSCDNWYLRSNFKHHMFAVHNLVKKFQCRMESCMRAIAVIDNFLEHLKSHSECQPFTCGCRSCLIRNAKTDNPVCINMLKKLKLKQYYQGMIYKCPKCWVKFSSPEGLERHNRKETHSHPCPECGKVQVSRRQLRMHAVMHADARNYLCEECGASFKTKRDLSKHHMSHSEFKPFICQECGKGFLFKNKLVRHRMTVHSNEKPFKCTVQNCDKAFSRRDKLNDHARTHLYYEPFHCRFCPKGFFRKDNLKDHEVLHTKDYRFKCDRCPKGFMRPKLLARHIAHEHGMPNNYEDPNDGEGMISQVGQDQQLVPLKLTKPKSRSRSKSSKKSTPEAQQVQSLTSQITYMIYQQAGSTMAAALQQAMQSVNAGADACSVSLPPEVYQAYNIAQQSKEQQQYQMTPVESTEEQISSDALQDRPEFRLN